jgi:hypothetical protein
MILVRKRYFRQHCEAVIRDIRQRHRVKKIFRNILRQARQAADIRLQKPSVRSEDELQPQIGHDIQPGEGIGAGLVGSTGLGLALALGSSQIQEAFASQNSLSNITGPGSPAAPATSEGRLSHESCRVVANAPMYTSSPRSAAIVLPMVSEEPYNGTRSDRRPQVRKRASKLFHKISR